MLISNKEKILKSNFRIKRIKVRRLMASLDTLLEDDRFDGFDMKVSIDTNLIILSHGNKTLGLLPSMIESERSKNLALTYLMGDTCKPIGDVEVNHDLATEWFAASINK